MPSGVQVAGTNRSGAKRRRAASESSTADHPESGRSLAERPLDQAGSIEFISEQADMETHTEGDGQVVIEERGGESQDREVVHLSPTNFDTARMPRTVSARKQTYAICCRYRMFGKHHSSKICSWGWVEMEGG